jgi:hypothetical protein
LGKSRIAARKALDILVLCTLRPHRHPFLILVTWQLKAETAMHLSFMVSQWYADVSGSSADILKLMCCSAGSKRQGDRNIKSILSGLLGIV